MKVLVTGGAGYIGSATSKLLLKDFEVIIVDNFTRGHEDAIPGIKYYKADIKNVFDLDKIFKIEKPDAVIHFAAKSLVGESVSNPYDYFENNVYGTLELLKVMISNNVKKIVFSSSAAVYGNAGSDSIKEDTPLNPQSPYGQTKLQMEEMMKAFDQAYGLKYVALRYFNVAGALDDGSIGEDHSPETHLIPIVIKAAFSGKPLKVFGNDYDTKDGTNIRDYVNVVDLAQAHILALNYLMKGGASDIFNLGTDHGSSNLEIIRTVEKVTGLKVNYEIVGRRAGDPDSLVACCEKAKHVLGFENKHSLEDSIKSAILFHKNHPEGYNK